MGNLLNKIVDNNALFACAIGILIIVLVALVYMIVKSFRNSKKINIYEEDLEDEDIKKVKNVKKEDIIETPDVFEKDLEEVIEEPVEEIEESEDEIEEIESIDTIEQRYEEEKEKEIEEVKEETTNNELAQLISKMEEDSKLKPEEIVANFEKEQEEQSIISYKELVNAVKNRQEEIYEDELEDKPLSTVSTIMEEIQKDSDEEYVEESEDEIEEPEEIIEEIEEEPVVVEKVKSSEEDDVIKFRKTDVISPVFGIVSDKKEYDDRTIDLSDIRLKDEDFVNTTEDDNSLTALDEIYKQMADDLFTTDEKLSETTSIDSLSRNEDFLQSLKDFRKNL